MGAAKQHEVHGGKPKAAHVYSGKSAPTIHILPRSRQSSVPISSSEVGQKLGSKGTGYKRERRYKRKRVQRGVKK